MNEEIIQEQDNMNSVSLQIAQAMANVKKISERIIGYVPYNYAFVSQKFNATSNRPAKITPLERAVVGILKVDGNQDFVTIGDILGLDVLHDTAEKEILNHAIESMRTYGVLEGDDSYLSLTEKGNIFASTGERPETYKGTFDLWIDPNHLKFTGLKNCLKAEAVETLTEDTESSDKIELSLDSIKEFAEQQASNFQTEKLRYILSNAECESLEKKQYKLFVCFLQSVRDNVITTFVYDANQATLLPALSDVIEQDQELKQQLLEKCIAIECENEDAEILSNSTEKTKEQAEAEEQLIADEDDANKQDESKIVVGSIAKDGRLHKKALYDSLSFEAELHNIFTDDNADEIWMISPWIGKAFVQFRLPYIKAFLNEGKKIFIAYSKDEGNIKSASSSGEMIVPSAQKAIDSLLNSYPSQFFCVQLPAFHTKNVIEKKGDQCIMFTGSFNVLSFSVNDKQTQIRREEMALAHHQMAVNKYDEYVKAFINSYIDKTRQELTTLKEEDKDEEITKYRPTSLETLVAISGNKNDYVDFFNEVETKLLLAKNAMWIKEVEELKQVLSPYFENGGVPNKERHNIEKKFGNLTRRYVNLTVSSDVKDGFDSLYEKFKKLPVGKNYIEKNSKQEGTASYLSSESLDIYGKMIELLNAKKKGRRIKFEDIALAKKLSGPQNKLATEEDLLNLLVALNLLGTAVHMSIEKKMQVMDVHNSLKRIIKRGDDFPELSIFMYEYKGKSSLIFDLHGVQFSFENVNLSLDQVAYIKNKDNKNTRRNGMLSFMNSCELLDIITNK